MAQYARVFAALDGGSTQRGVAERALEVASNNGAKLLFGSVVDSVPYEANGVDFKELRDEVEKRLREDVADILQQAEADASIPSVDLQVRAGRVTETLMNDMIAPFDPSLVICGERGLSNIKYAFVGSVSTYLIRNATCDVLVVKQR